MSANREEIDRITAVMKRRGEQLWSYPNVVGFGVGFKVKGGKKLDQLAIIVFVKKKVPRSDLQRHEVIPTDVEGALTDVQESGEIIAYPTRTEKWRPAPPGISIGHPLITAGTFGCVVLKGDVRKILSNNHILANCNAANIGDAIYQPGVADGGGPGDTLALLEDWVPIVFSDVANNLVDAAIADPINDADILDEILEIGIPTDVVAPELDMSVVKSGRTSAVTNGTITAIHATVSVGYGAPGTARFIDQIITDKIIYPGDSGSLLLTHPEHKAVGLCFAASAVIGVASDIQYAESLLGISIYTGAMPASVDLYAKLEVPRGSMDLLGKTEIKQLGSRGLLGRFSAQVSLDLPGRTEVKNIDSAELLCVIEVVQPTEIALIELEPGSSKTLTPKIRSLTGTPLDTIGGPLSRYKPDYIRSREGETLEVHGGPLTHYKLDYLRSREGEALEVHGGPLTHYKPDYIRSREGSEFLVLWGLEVGSQDLWSRFEVLQGWADLYGRFETGQDSVGLLAKVEIPQGSKDLLAGFVSQTTRDLFAKVEVGQGSRSLLSRFIVRHIGMPVELLSKTIIAHAGVPVELFGSFSICHWSDLRGRLCIPKIYDFSEASGVAFWWWGSGGLDQQIDFEMRSPTGSWIGKFYDGPAEWRLIFLEWENLTEVDIDGTRPDKSNINGFFWTYHTPGLRRLDAILAIEEPLFWHTDLCVADVYFSTQVIERWNWTEQQLVTTILDDTYNRLGYSMHFCNSGWRFALDHHGASTKLQCSFFHWYYPGDVEYHKHYCDEEIFLKFDIGGIAHLDRLAWARVELYRYAGDSGSRNSLTVRRIGQCDEVPETFTFWNPANRQGGCNYHPLGPPPKTTWDEMDLDWVNSGRRRHCMCHVSTPDWPYMGLPGFNQEPDGYGLTAENDEWDMLRLTSILRRWFNGEKQNQGIGITAGSIDGGYDYRTSTWITDNTPTYYSKESVDPRTPRLRLQHIPSASLGLWSFYQPESWEINLVDPYRGGGSLHLMDWSKRNYDRSYTATPKVTLVSDYNFAEGCVDTACRLNRATYPRLESTGMSHYPVCNPQIKYMTPLDNYLEIYFRYQDNNNYYKIRLRPAGESSRIYRKRYGGLATLETFDSGIAVGDWERIRVFWVESAGELHICCYIWDGADWSFLAGYADANNYWATGGDVAFESYDADLDDTEISERIFP